MSSKPLDRKFDTELRDWSLNGGRLSGRCYFDSLTTGAHPFKDGELITTSPVVYITSTNNHCCKIAITRSGTRYLLR